MLLTWNQLVVLVSVEAVEGVDLEVVVGGVEEEVMGGFVAEEVTGEGLEEEGEVVEVDSLISLLGKETGYVLIQRM